MHGLHAWLQHRQWAAGGAVLLVLAVLAVALRGGLPAGIQQALQQGPGPAHWEGIPNISLAVTMPSWAGCPRPPCQYGQVADGAVDASVSSSRPPTVSRASQAGSLTHVLCPNGCSGPG